MDAIIIYDTVSYRNTMTRKPLYMDKHSTQTLREGLAEYYALNPHVTDPSTQPSDFGKILRAHDVIHAIYACDTGMYDELKLLPLSWWTSEYTFQAYLKMRNSPAVKVLPGVILELIPIWFKTRNRQKLLPFLEFEPLLDRSLLDIRQEFDLLPFIK